MWIFLSCIASIIMLILLSGIWSLGVLSLRWVYGSVKRAEAFAAAPIVGSALVSLWLNFGARFAGWDIAVCLSIFFLSVSLGVLVWFWKLLPPWDMGERKEFRLLLAITIPFFLLMALVGGIFDEGWHFPLATLIANGHWPAQFPFDPSQSLTYHFGFDLLCALFIRIGVPTPIASDFLTVFLEISLLGMGWVIVRNSLPLIAYRFGVLFIWFFAGTFGWIVRPFRSLLPQILSVVPLFTSSMGGPIGLIVYTKSHLIAMGFLLMTWMFKEQWKNLHPKWMLVWLVGLAASAFSSETIFAVQLHVLLVWLFFHVVTPQKRVLLVGGYFLSVGVIYLQGGLFRDAILHFFQLGTAEQASISSFALRSSARFKTLLDWIDLRSPLAWLRMILEWGAQIGLFTLAWKQWSQRDGYVRALLIGSGICVILPFIVIFPIGQHDMLRFWGNAFFITNLLGAMVLARWSKRYIMWIGMVIVLCIGGFGAVVFSNFPVTNWMGRSAPQVTNISLWKPLVERAWLPKGSVVWTSSPRPLGDIPDVIRNIPLIFGVYVQSCYTFYNHTLSSACDIARTSSSTVEQFRNMGVTHLLIDEEWARAHAQDEALQLSRVIAVYRSEDLWIGRAAVEHLWHLDRQTYKLFALP